MYEGLIEFIETTLFTLVNKIAAETQDGVAQAQQIVAVLLGFADKNPGMTRVMIGDALVNEDERLQTRMNQFLERIEMAIKQSLRIAVTQGQAIESQASLRAGMIVSLILGRWHRFAKTGFKQKPLDQVQ